MSNLNMFPSNFTNSTTVFECPGSGDGKSMYITAASNAKTSAVTATIYNTTATTGTAFGVATAIQTTDTFKIPANGTLSLPGVGVPAKGVQVSDTDCSLFYYIR
jgi:hypothetical protein